MHSSPGNLPSRSLFIPVGKHPSVGAAFQPKAQTKSHPSERGDLLEGKEREKLECPAGDWERLKEQEISGKRFLRPVLPPFSTPA